jgi:hypothetical protein
MVIRILSSAASFQGVSYNTDKVDKNKGELMKVANFGPLQGLDKLRPEDYKNYLKMLSAQNKRVSQPQFHAVISAKGRTYDKTALTEIATQWLASMGYAGQPYLIVYHNDTNNNHVHMVSTRIDRNGKKISSGFENIRAIQNLNRVLGIDEKHNAKQDIEKALSYQFTTKAQFMMILECQAYQLKETSLNLEVIKFGVKQAEIDLLKIEERINKYQPDTERKTQLKAIFHKYAAVYDTALIPHPIPLPGAYSKKSNGFTSEFSACLKEKLGFTLLFHASGDKPPYGYSIVDHAGKSVFKGAEIMPLKELLNIQRGELEVIENEGHVEISDLPEHEISAETQKYYAAILKAVLYNYPDILQGLYHQGLNILRNGEDFILADQSAHIFINVSELLNENDYQHLVEIFSQSAELTDEASRQYDRIPGVSIAADIDDEAIHGRNRRRRKATGSGHKR